MKISSGIFTKKFLGIALILLVGVSQTLAQSSAESLPSEFEVISVDTNLVTLNVSVTDRKNRHVAGLKAENFQLTDAGKPVAPAFFDEQGPESIVFLVDISSSMKGQKWQNLRAGMKHFLMKGRDGSDYTLIAFNQQASLIVAHVDAERLWQSFDSLQPNGETALYDALMLGLESLDRASRRHKALVLLSDGEDNCSHAGLSQVEQEVLARRATIYPVGILIDDRLSPYQPNGRKLLNELAAGTGGVVFFPAPDQVPRVLELVRTDISNQYSFGYYPADKAAGWRQVHVTLAPALKDVRLRYQEQYVMAGDRLAKAPENQD